MDLSIFSALAGQLFNSPACALLILPVSIVAFVLERWQGFNSKYVPVVCIVLGAALYPLLVKPATVPLEFPHPYVVLILNGLILGFCALLIHATLIKWLMGKFLPANGGPGQ